MRTICLTGSNRPKGPHLIIPYSLDANDMRFINPQGFAEGEAFFVYLRDTFDILYAEGATKPEDDVGRACIAGWPAGRAAPPDWYDFWITSLNSIASGRRRVSKLRSIGIASISLSPPMLPVDCVRVGGQWRRLRSMNSIGWIARLLSPRSARCLSTLHGLPRMPHDARPFSGVNALL